MRQIVRISLVVATIACYAVAQQAPQKLVVSPEVRAALDHISADSLRGHLSFIASDALGGRNTPSPGLDIAAEYVAAQFRRAGLEPAGDDGYFQTANFLIAETPMDAFELRFRAGAETVSVAKNQVSFNIEKALNISAALFKIDYGDAASIAALTPQLVGGKVVITEIPDSRRFEEQRRVEMFLAREQFLKRMAELSTPLVISINRTNTIGSGPLQGRVIDPENRRGGFSPTGASAMTVHDPKVVALFDTLKPGLSNAQLELRLPALVEKPIKLRNVIGLLRGSDPALKDTFVLVTAHYDHLGTRPELAGDNIFNGANDDGSGTVSVIELASALAT